LVRRVPLRALVNGGTVPTTVVPKSGRDRSVAVWLFVFVVATCDLFFAAYHIDTFAEWEANPFATWLYESAGFLAVALFRYGSLGFAWIVSHLDDTLGRWVTGTVGVAHMYLAVHLAIAWYYLS
jgi:hypothetical protein